jgi:hypothetical protein
MRQRSSSALLTSQMYITDIATAESTLVAEEADPILKVRLNSSFLFLFNVPFSLYK